MSEGIRLFRCGQGWPSGHDLWKEKSCLHITEGGETDVPYLAYPLAASEAMEACVEALAEAKRERDYQKSIELHDAPLNAARSRRSEAEALDKAFAALARLKGG